MCFPVLPSMDVKCTSTLPPPANKILIQDNTKQDSVFLVVTTPFHFLGVQAESFPLPSSSLSTKTKQRPVGLERANSTASLLSRAPPSLPQGGEHRPHIIWDRNNITQSVFKFSKYFPTSIAGCCVHTVNSCQELPNSILLCLPKSLG